MRNYFRDPSNRSLTRVKSLLGKLLCNSAIGWVVDRATGGTVISRGVRVDTRSPAVTNSTRASMFFGLYEGAEMRMVRSHLRPTEVLVDLGCSLGVLASAAAKKLPPGAVVVGVEANPALLALAEKNIKTNAPHVTTSIVHGAVDYTHPRGTPVDFVDTTDHTAAHMASAQADQIFSAPSTTLACVLEDAGIRDDYTLLMDIEGAESGVLRNDRGVLNWCTQVVAELHDTEVDGKAILAADLLATFREIGFAVVASYGNVHLLERVP